MIIMHKSATRATSGTSHGSCFGSQPLKTLVPDIYIPCSHQASWVAIQGMSAHVLSERTDSDPVNIPMTDHDDCSAPVVPEPGCLLHVPGAIFSSHIPAQSLRRSIAHARAKLLCHWDLARAPKCREGLPGALCMGE